MEVRLQVNYTVEAHDDMDARKWAKHIVKMLKDSGFSTEDVKLHEIMKYKKPRKIQI